jgi:hypothetical protein
MRIRISEEEDFPNQAAMWEANMERSLRGRKGQAALRELEAALIALPDKRLIANDTVSADGAVCSIAALAKHRGYNGNLILPQMATTDDDWFNENSDKFHDEYEYEEAVETAMMKVAGDLGIPRMVAFAIIYENDDGLGRNPTPEQRYDHMLRWVQRQLRAA